MTEQRMHDPYGAGDGGGRYGRDAEHALVAALVLGQANPADLSGRLSGRDFYDPAAGLIFDTVLRAARGMPGDPGGAFDRLPALLRAEGQLRSDGYPIRPLLDWLPTVSVPAHPEAWSALVVASALGRQVDAAGTRLQQAAGAYQDLPFGAGRVLAFAAAQRATVHAALMRWEELPATWRHSLTLGPRGVAPFTRAACGSVHGDELLMEREVLAGFIAAPELIDRLRWLHPSDFADPAHAELFSTVQQLHADRRPIDLVTVAAALPLHSTPVTRSLEQAEPGPSPEVVLSVCRSLQPHRVFPAMVPWLARQQLEASMLRDAHTTGQRLCHLAAASIEAGGASGPVLRQAVRELDELGDQTRRLEAACRVAPSRDDHSRGASRPALLPGLEPTADPTVEPHLRLAPAPDDATIDLTARDDPERGPSSGRSVN